MASVYRTLGGGVLALSGAMAWAGSAAASPQVLDDATAATPLLDGVIGAGEYGGFFAGVGSSFGSLIGSGRRLGIDGDAAGALVLALDASGGNCALGASDAVVVYLDSRGGGFASTAGFTDSGDARRSAASGRSATGQAILDFAPGFGADFAIVLDASGAELFELAEGDAHRWVAALPTASSGDLSSACVRELALNMADIDSAPGAAFDFVATLLETSQPFRSNELVGAALTTEGSPGQAALALGEGDRDTFQSYAALPSLVRHARAFGFAGFAGSGFAGHEVATAGQLPSDNWSATGWSDGALSYGESKTTGDYARGVANSAVSTGGFYSFMLGPDDASLGLQPGSSDFAPGSLTLRLANETGWPLYGLEVSYELRVRNDQGRSSSFELAVAGDDESFVAVPSVAYVSPLAASGSEWQLTKAAAAVTSLQVPPAGYAYVRFTSGDVGGSGYRDEFALDDLVLRPLENHCPTELETEPCSVEICEPESGEVTRVVLVGESCAVDEPCTLSSSCDADGICQKEPVVCEFGCLVETGLCAEDPCVDGGCAEGGAAGTPASEGGVAGVSGTEGGAAGAPEASGGGGTFVEPEPQGGETSTGSQQPEGLGGAAGPTCPEGGGALGLGGGATAPPASPLSPGCSCALPPQRTSGQAGLLSILLLAAAVRDRVARRRRRA
jgi:hypothetical protein